MEEVVNSVDVSQLLAWSLIGFMAIGALVAAGLFIWACKRYQSFKHADNEGIVFLWACFYTIIATPFRYLDRLFSELPAEDAAKAAMEAQEMHVSDHLG